MADLASALETLRGQVPEVEVVIDEDELAEKAHDWWVRGSMERRIGTAQSCGAVLKPKSTVEVSAIAAWANTHRIAIVPYGLGSGVCGAIQATTDQVVLDMASMNRILDIDEDNLLVRVQPGKRGSELEAELAEKGLTMAHFPQSIDLSSVGGWCATRASGQLSTLYGNIEDMLLGAEIVLASGEVISLPAVPRSSTGPDLKHLFLGSEGILGVFTELTFRIHKAAESTKGQAFTMPTLAAGIDVFRKVIQAGWKPAVTRLYDATEAGRNFQIKNDNQPVLLFLSEGPAQLVEVEAAAIESLVLADGGAAHGSDPVDSWMEHRNHVPDLVELLEKGLVVDTIEVAIGWAKLTELFEEVCRQGNALERVIAMSGHISHCYTQGANIYFTFIATENDPQKTMEIYDEVWDLTMRVTHEMGGTIAHHHGIGRVRKRWLPKELGAATETLISLKKAIDPNGIMNPGALVDVP